MKEILYGILHGNMREILYIIFGWVLGLLGSPIVSRIEKHYKRKDLKITIFSELKNLRFKLVTACYKIQMHLGFQDKSTLQWIKTACEKYRADCPKNILEYTEKLLQLSDEQFIVASNLCKADENTCLAVKTYSLPFIDSILENLSVFDSKFQRDILEVQSQINILNEEIENAIFNYRLTFNPSCMNTNEDITMNNIKDNYIEIERRCRIIVDKIDKILDD